MTNKKVTASVSNASEMSVVMYKTTLLSEIVYYSEIVKNININTNIGSFLLSKLSTMVDEYLNVSPELRGVMDYEPDSVICTFE